MRIIRMVLGMTSAFFWAGCFLMESSSLVIAPATALDRETLFLMVMELARYEKMEHLVHSTADTLWNAMSGPHSTAEALIARWDGEPAGIAIYFHNFSTFAGKPGLYLEDLFVGVEFRRRGIAHALLQTVAQVAVARDCGRLEWSVLDWNEPALHFYESIGAVMQKEWRLMRLEPAAFGKLAAGQDL